MNNLKVYDDYISIIISHRDRLFACRENKEMREVCVWGGDSKTGSIL